MFDASPAVPCRAIVERLDRVIGGGAWQWRVLVKTAPFWPYVMSRVYLIVAPSDTLAAREGIRRFEEEAKARPRSVTLH